MGKPTGFMEYQRRIVPYADADRRLGDYNEFLVPLSDGERREQGARCMDCGVPFCHSSFGCPVDNLIPEWNDLVYRGRDKDAFKRLMKTNNFPEFTGRVCPAPCETACVLGINEPAVTIKNNEYFIIEKAFAEGYVSANPPALRTGKKVAVVGSGPAGLAAADQLNQAGHRVVVFERADRPGGLLMYGIPNMKLDKNVVLRRIGIMEEEGVEFRTGIEVGVHIQAEALEADFDAVVLTCGSTVPRDLPVPGRGLEGIHYAMDFLTGNTRTLLDTGNCEKAPVSAEGKHVIVIGGGDTGCDCIGTSLRHGCAGLVNFELLPQPPTERTDEFPWPMYPKLLKVDYGHEEAIKRFGKDPREYNILTKEFIGDERVEAVKTVRVQWKKDENGRYQMSEVPGSEEIFRADLVLLAMGFVGAEKPILESFGIDTTGTGTVDAEYGRFATSRKGVFSAGDMRRGQSLVVWAINEGRGAAREVDRYLMGRTYLP
ncbi:glutamate synthase subunit beta [Marispirochaeta aestuarii]|uniref:glutamate synthase subunit beta n=1 Tax=Marispirochaeta aestuarii TaxID=1963862 RepID=UPI0029C6CDD6|nr:glutamate synthase subunit beta [Marispirochaeta aestuarii]